MVAESDAGGFTFAIDVESGCHGMAICVGVWEEVGDIDGEFSAEEEGEEGKAGKGDYAVLVAGDTGIDHGAYRTNVHSGSSGNHR